mgnify:FL=1
MSKTYAHYTESTKINVVASIITYKIILKRYFILK